MKAQRPLTASKTKLITTKLSRIKRWSSTLVLHSTWRTARHLIWVLIAPPTPRLCWALPNALASCIAAALSDEFYLGKKLSEDITLVVVMKPNDDEQKKRLRPLVVHGTIKTPSPASSARFNDGPPPSKPKPTPIRPLNFRSTKQGHVRGPLLSPVRG